MAAVRLAEAQAQLDAAEAAHAAALRASEDERQQIQQERDELRQRFEQSQVQLDRLQATVEGERQAYEHARSASDSAWQRLSAEHGQQREAFDQLQTAFQTLEQVASALSAERARLEGAVGERDSQLSAQAERHRVAEQAAHETIAQLEEQRREALDSSRSETARLQETIGALTRELDGLRTRAEALRGDAERVPDLQAQLDASRREARRLFERARYGVCHCTAAGVITDANHTFVTLLGRRRVEELRNTDFAAAVVDCAGDLGWVLERARTVRKTETVETNWMTRDGRPLVVRLQALSTAAGSLEIVVEDITEARALEARLRQAQRMEAVGRLASEVAVTCDGLLRDVTGSAHEWLAAIARDDPRRRQVEWLLTDVQRAASFLQHLGVYSASQARALEPVSVQRVLQDLAPVLKQVVGERIDVVTPKASSNPFDVEVDAERVERILVTVAAYARARIADGGQMKIDLATTTVGRRLIVRFPSVRPGPHVLVTVTELPGARASRHEESPAASGDKPGVDLGGLMDLVSNCGGHLWVDAQPAGNLVVKIHLPRAAAGATSATRRSDVHSERGGRLARWLRLGSNGVRA
jgi:PAS domain-containing protein